MLIAIKNIDITMFVFMTFMLFFAPWDLQSSVKSKVWANRLIRKSQVGEISIKLCHLRYLQIYEKCTRDTKIAEYLIKVHIEDNF